MYKKNNNTNIIIDVIFVFLYIFLVIPLCFNIRILYIKGLSLQIKVFFIFIKIKELYLQVNGFNYLIIARNKIYKNNFLSLLSLRKKINPFFEISLYNFRVVQSFNEEDFNELFIVENILINFILNLLKNKKTNKKITYKTYYSDYNKTSLDIGLVLTMFVILLSMVKLIFGKIFYGTKQNK